MGWFKTFAQHCKQDAHRVSDPSYSHVSVEAVRGAENPQVVEDRSTTQVNGQELDADLPGPRPLRGLSPAHNTRHTRGPNQRPLPTTSWTESETDFMLI